MQMILAITPAITKMIATKLILVEFVKLFLLLDDSKIEEVE